MNLKLSTGIFYLLLLALLFFFVADAANKYLEVYANGQSVSIFVRLGFEIIFLFISLFILTKVTVNLYFSLLLLFCLFLVGQLSLLLRGAENYADFLVNMKIYNKYIFVFIVYTIVDYVLKYNKTLFDRLVTIFYALFLINVLVAIAGMLGDTELVRSYPLRERFGYSGLIPKRNEATLFYMLGISLAYYRSVILGILERWKFYIALIGSLLLGTKGIYIFLILLFIFHFRKNKKLFKNLLGIALVGGILALVILPQTEMYAYYYSQAQKQGLWTMLLSGRDIIFFNEIGGILDNWGGLNYLVGGQNQNDKAIEMDFLDLFFFFGILGAILYLLLMFKCFFPWIKGSPYQKFFMISYMFLAFFGGHFFASAVNGLYFVIFILYLNYSEVSIIESKSTIET